MISPQGRNSSNLRTAVPGSQQQRLLQQQQQFQLHQIQQAQQLQSQQHLYQHYNQQARAVTCTQVLAEAAASRRRAKAPATRSINLVPAGPGAFNSLFLNKRGGGGEEEKATERRTSKLEKQAPIGLRHVHSMDIDDPDEGTATPGFSQSKISGLGSKSSCSSGATTPDDGQGSRLPSLGKTFYQEVLNRTEVNKVFILGASTPRGTKAVVQL